MTIPDEERDKNLTDNLKAEWPGILAWMIEGCAAWQGHGLMPSSVVTAATDAYLESEDAIAAWIDDRADRDVNAWTASSDLFISWKNWADHAGEYSGSLRQFVQNLEDRGFTPLHRMCTLKPKQNYPI